jgi:hypothetical protein
VRWRILLAAVFGLMLTLPLVYLLKDILFLSPMRGDTRDWSIRPMLSVEERRRLVTFDRACRGSRECEAPLGCLQDLRRFSRSVCMGSECNLDSHCPEGQSCRAVKTQDVGPVVRLCIATGIRKEGQACDRLQL